MTFNDGNIDEYTDKRIIALPDDPGTLPADCDLITVGLSDVANYPIDRSAGVIWNIPRTYGTEITYDFQVALHQLKTRSA